MRVLPLVQQDVGANCCSLLLRLACLENCEIVARYLRYHSNILSLSVETKWVCRLSRSKSRGKIEESTLLLHVGCLMGVSARCILRAVVPVALLHAAQFACLCSHLWHL